MSLPRPDFRFKGQVGRTFEDSDPPTFPGVVRPPKGAPNVLLILLDDAGYGQFSAFGGGVPSPNIEKLAAQGCATRASTRRPCARRRARRCSRAATITSPDRRHHGACDRLRRLHRHHSEERRHVSEILRQNGYATAWIGKNHNTPAWETSEVGPFDRWPSGLGFRLFLRLQLRRHEPVRACALREPEPGAALRRLEVSPVD
jgi:arylsulfatase